MRAKLIFEFERGLDPKESMVIGRLANIPMEKIKNSTACAKNYSFDDLQDIYRRIRNKSNIKLDGVPVENLSYNDWVTFNNKIVNGIKALRRKKAKKEAGFKEGELLRAEHEGKIYFGIYSGVDRNGRIRAKGHNINMAFSPEKFRKATQEETETFIKQGITLEKHRMKMQIERARNLVMRGALKKSALDDFIRAYENKFGEKYEGQNR